MAAACRVEPTLSEAARRAALVLERYAPVSLSAAAADFTREVVARGSGDAGQSEGAVVRRFTVGVFR
jgi:hypothetical protein